MRWKKKQVDFASYEFSGSQFFKMDKTFERIVTGWMFVSPKSSTYEILTLNMYEEVGLLGSN